MTRSGFRYIFSEALYRLQGHTPGFRFSFDEPSGLLSVLNWRTFSRKRGSKRIALRNSLPSVRRLMKPFPSVR